MGVVIEIIVSDLIVMFDMFRNFEPVKRFENIISMGRPGSCNSGMGERILDMLESMTLDVNVGLHQGSVLSPLLFVIVIQVITKEYRLV